MRGDRRARYISFRKESTMHKIHLYGSLAKKFGRIFELDISTPSEAIRALCANFPDFAKTIREGAWTLTLGNSRRTGEKIGEDELSFGMGKRDLHIAPAVQGSKNSGGALKIILGVALIGAAFLVPSALGVGMATPILGGFTYSNVALLGLGIALSGASQLMSNQKTSNDEDKGSFTFTGPVNMSNQGATIPLIYGFGVAVGSTPISASFEVEQI